MTETTESRMTDLAALQTIDADSVLADAPAKLSREGRLLAQQLRSDMTAKHGAAKAWTVTAEQYEARAWQLEQAGNGPSLKREALRQSAQSADWKAFQAEESVSSRWGY